MHQNKSQQKRIVCGLLCIKTIEPERIIALKIVSMTSLQKHLITLHVILM